MIHSYVRLRNSFRLADKAPLRICLQAILLIVLFGGVMSCASAPDVPPLSHIPSQSSSVAQSAPVAVPVSSVPMAQATAPQPTGSVWNDSSGSLFRDIKAKNIGDVVTITVVEQSSGSKTAATNTSRNTDLQGSFQFDGVTTGGAATPTGALSFGPYQAQFANTFKGTGSTTRTDNMSAYMTATVVDTLPNGNLVIRGSRWTKVNNDMQQIVLEGVIRPVDITRNNTVLSQHIADAKIFLVGKGPLAKQQKPGWLGQIVDFISPF